MFNFAESMENTGPELNALVGKTVCKTTHANDVSRIYRVGLHATLKKFSECRFLRLYSDQLRFSVHAATLKVISIQDFTPICDLHVGHCQIYVDSSGGTVFIGLEEGSYGDPNFQGADSHTNNTAELLGMVEAQIYTFSHSSRVKSCTYQMCYDPEFAARATVNNSRIKSHGTLPKCSTGLRQTFDQKVSLHYDHVFAHKEEPISELADKICGHMVDSGRFAQGYIDTSASIGEFPVHSWAPDENYTRDADWAFLCWAPDIMEQKYPIYDIDQNYFVFQHHHVVAQHMIPASNIAEMFDTVLKIPEDKVEMISVRGYQNSCQIFKGPKKEYRAEENELRDEGQFIQATSAACQRQCGSAIWRNKHIPIAEVEGNTKPITFIRGGVQNNNDCISVSSAVQEVANTGAIDKSYDLDNKVSDDLTIVFRSYEPEPQTERVTDAKVIARLELLSPLSLVIEKPLKGFVRVVRNCSPTLFLAFSHAFTTGTDRESSWQASIYRIRKKLSSGSDKLIELREAELSEWVVAIKAQSNRFLKPFKNLIAEPHRNTTEHRRPKPKTNVRNAEPENHDLEPFIFECDVLDCECNCSSIEALNYHYSDKHKLKYSVRLRVDDLHTCSCCLGYYFSRIRHENHLMQPSPKCNAYHSMYVPEILVEDYVSCELQDIETTRNNVKQGHRRNKSMNRPELVDGPLTFQSYRLSFGIENRFRKDELQAVVKCMNSCTWLEYRVPLFKAGHPVHLHVTSRGLR